MPHLLRAFFASATVVGLGSAPAAASVGFAIDPNGSVYSIDTLNPAMTTIIVGTSLFSSDGLARNPATGQLWGINWNGNLVEVDPVAGTSFNRGVVPRPTGSGFYKDLAWDPVHGRLLATHLGSAIGGPGTANRIVEINPQTASFTELGLISGLPGTGAQVLGLAVNAQGQASIFDYNTSFIYDLGTLPALPVGTILATPRAVRAGSFAIDLRGLEYDHVTGQLFASGDGLREIAADGSSTVLPGFSSPVFRDMTFIPAPASAPLLLLATLLTSRRSRRCSVSR